MIAAISPSISFYTPTQQPPKAELVQADAVALAEKAKIITKETAEAKTAQDAQQLFLQTKYVGPARSTARMAALGNGFEQALQAHYTGPAREMARQVALGAEVGASKAQAEVQDMLSGTHAGPKPASVIAADEYRQAMKAMH